MTATQARSLVALAAAAASALVLASAAGTRSDPIEENFVGQVPGTNAFVAVYRGERKIAAGKQKVIAYVCDSRKIAEWFHALTNATQLSLTSSDGATLAVRFSGNKLTGMFATRHGRRRAFGIRFRHPPAGLYRAEKTVRGKHYLGGWIILADGRQRGSVKVRTTIVATPILDLSSLTVSLPGAGMLTAMRLTD